ncbi:MAG: hypothetical protein KBT27_15850 [Prevotellaceae bacterium]|nr:hypothetical protein [Candidatus Faecinaster equi]
MPNWCDTTYKCVGKKEDIQSLHKTLEQLQAMKKPFIKNGFGNMWLGCVVSILGGKWEDVRCRGEIIDFSMDGDILVISQSTAWCEQEEFRYFLEQHYPGMKIFYQEEEPGCDVYYTNDETGDYFSDKYMLDSYDGCEYFNSLHDVAAKVKELTGTDVKTEEDIEKALDEYQEQMEKKGKEVFYSLPKFNYSAD